MSSPANKIHASVLVALRMQDSVASCQSKFAVHEVMDCRKSIGSSKRLHWKCKYIHVFLVFIMRKDDINE